MFLSGIFFADFLVTQNVMAMLCVSFEIVTMRQHQNYHGRQLGRIITIINIALIIFVSFMLLYSFTAGKISFKFSISLKGVLALDHKQTNSQETCLRTPPQHTYSDLYLKKCIISYMTIIFIREPWDNSCSRKILSSSFLGPI